MSWTTPAGGPQTGRAGIRSAGALVQCLRKVPPGLVTVGLGWEEDLLNEACGVKNVSLAEASSCSLCAFFSKKCLAKVNFSLESSISSTLLGVLVTLSLPYFH